MTIKYYYGYAGSNVTIYSVEKKSNYGGDSYIITRYFTKNEDNNTIEWKYEKSTKYSMPSGWQIVEQDFIIRNMIPWSWA